MVTKKELQQENEQLWKTINQLRNNIAELEDEIETLRNENHVKRRTINKLRNIIVSLHGPVFFDEGD